MTLIPKVQGLLSKRGAEILYDAEELEVYWENFQRPEPEEISLTWLRKHDLNREGSHRSTKADKL